MAKPKKNQPRVEAVSSEASTTPKTSNDVTTTRTSPRASVLALMTDANTQRALYLVVLAALYAPLSQLVLAPVYGALPAAMYHKWVQFGGCMLAFGIKGYVPEAAEKFFPGFLWWIPTIQFILTQLSSNFGTPWGALITEVLTTLPMITMSLYTANQYLDRLQTGLSPDLAESAPSVFNYTVFTILARYTPGFLPGMFEISHYLSRVTLQLVIAAGVQCLMPQAYFWPAVPSIVFNAIGNTHIPLQRTTEIMESTLALYNYTLIDRKESTTGYISVLEDHNQDFRVMRADHSLLGGEWLLPPGRKRGLVGEPVYAVFTMLESVRLVERTGLPKDAKERAAVIGVGIGTVPSALVAHGIETTTVELDPVVYQWARQYFNMPSMEQAYIGDARAFVQEKGPTHAEYYDYIVHDVFTGGAEPVGLFTVDFITGLRDMLKPNGVISINYAGNLALPGTSMVYRTILTVFPSCRVFREDEQEAADGTPAVGIKHTGGDFTNLVFICNKDGSPVRFRRPVEADYLGTISRRSYLVPKKEVLSSSFNDHGPLLTSETMKQLEQTQVESAIGHWKLMRLVMPDAVWENW